MGRLVVTRVNGGRSDEKQRDKQRHSATLGASKDRSSLLQQSPRKNSNESQTRAPRELAKPAYKTTCHSKEDTVTVLIYLP